MTRVVSVSRVVYREQESKSMFWAEVFHIIKEELLLLPEQIQDLTPMFWFDREAARAILRLDLYRLSIPSRYLRRSSSVGHPVMGNACMARSTASPWWTASRAMEVKNALSVGFVLDGIFTSLL